VCAKTNEKHRKESLEDPREANTARNLGDIGETRREGSSEGKGESDHA